MSLEKDPFFKDKLRYTLLLGIGMGMIFCVMCIFIIENVKKTNQLEYNNELQVAIKRHGEIVEKITVDKVNEILELSNKNFKFTLYQYTDGKSELFLSSVSEKL